MSRRKPRILVVDDNLEMARGVSEGLSDADYDAVAVGAGVVVVLWLVVEHFDGVVTDLRMAGTDGLAALAASRQRDPDRPVIVMTAYSAIDTAIESIRRGAYHYLTKPFKQEELAIFLGRALDEVRVRREAPSLKSALKSKWASGYIIGHSAAMPAGRDRILRVADAPAPGSVTGETGTG